MTFHLKYVSWLMAPGYSHHHPGSQLSPSSPASTWAQVQAGVPPTPTSTSSPALLALSPGRLQFPFLFTNTEASLWVTVLWTHTACSENPGVAHHLQLFGYWHGPWSPSSPGSPHSLETSTPGFGHEGLDHRPLHMCAPQPEMPLGVWKSPLIGRCNPLSSCVK